MIMCMIGYDVTFVAQSELGSDYRKAADYISVLQSSCKQRRASGHRN